MPPLDMPPGDAKELAASLEGMVKQFAKGMGLDGDANFDGMEWGWERRRWTTCSER